MKLLILPAIILLCSLQVFAQTETLFQATDHPEYVEGEILVKYKATAAPGIAQATAEARGLRILSSYQEIGLFRCTIDSSKTLSELLNELNAEDNIEYAEPNYMVHILETPNDPRYAEQWALNNTGQTGGVSDADVDAPEAWNIQTGSVDIVVGVIDTGVDFNHPDLAPQMWTNPGESGNGRESNGIDDDGNGYIDDWRGWDFANNDNDPFDDNAHGTHVAGIIGAKGDDGVGIVGLNWNVKMVALKFLTGSGSGSTSDAIDAILYAASMEIPILNNSWGSSQFSQSLEDAIAVANSAGVLFLAAAGNDSKNTDSSPNYPSNHTVENVVSVASSDASDQLSSFSNYGRLTVDLAAPGSSILSTVPNDGYDSFSGTSMATPYAAGVAALAWAQFPSSSALDIKYRLMGSVDPVNAMVANTVAEGRVNAFTALSTSPLITTVRHLETSDTINPYTITAFVVDDDSIASATLVYSVDSSASISVDMSGSAHAYEAQIPPQLMGSSIRYHVEAVDNEGNTTTGSSFTFLVTDDIPDPGGADCGCGGFAVSLHTGNRQVDVWGTFAINLLLLASIVFYLKRRR